MRNATLGSDKNSEKLPPIFWFCKIRCDLGQKPKRFLPQNDHFGPPFLLTASAAKALPGLGISHDSRASFNP